jgi:hypothetical protein
MLQSRDEQKTPPQSRIDRFLVVSITRCNRLTAVVRLWRCFGHEI